MECFIRGTDFDLWQADALQWFNIRPVVNIKVPFPVKWLRPHHNYCLNVDGAFKGTTGICGGGGCFRDSSGQFIYGFAFYYGAGSSLLAESREMHDGLRLALERRLPVSILYSDSAQLVGAIHSGRCPHWSVFPWWKGICKMVDQLKPIIQHSFREGNQVADCLANHACAQADNTAMASRGRRGAQTRDDEQRREERGEQQAPAPQGPTVLPPPPPVDYGVFMQGLVQAMQTQAQTQAALQAQLQAQAQAPAPVPQEHGHGGPSIMERFKRMAPPSFKAESQPLLAES
ncbi:hypothetical protein Taro_040481 [Colocasia esculenta]|uniref:RNase H type-1 domain-containing protein n=1 Tax=Colocasia esculenta TaxID=4460 RepID=A0A843WM10_COLES|nr:hypothetical protein [Colocasia esculenta]